VGNRISQCTLYGNKDAGIRQNNGSASQINGNLVSGTRGVSTYGIAIFSQSPNLIVQNTCFGHTQNFYFEAAATHGPIVTASGALSTTNGAAGLSPWANFSR
jgi:parallel beta-helix repeat protein